MLSCCTAQYAYNFELLLVKEIINININIIISIKVTLIAFRR